MAQGKLRLAISQFNVRGDVRANGAAVRRHMQRAADGGADVVHFSEAALSGYAGQETLFDAAFDWAALARETEAIQRLAERLGLWAVLGTAHRQRRGKPFNSLYLITPRGEIQARYDKRFCTVSDLRHYAAGRRFPTCVINGVRCGFLICYDFRFPEMYRAYLRKGVRLMFHSFHQVAVEPPTLMRQVAPAHIISRAAENFMYVSANNCGRRHQWFNSRLVAPDGGVVKQARWDRADLIIADVDLARAAALYNAPRGNARRAMDGLLYSVPGRMVN